MGEESITDSPTLNLAKIYIFFSPTRSLFFLTFCYISYQRYNSCNNATTYRVHTLLGKPGAPAGHHSPARAGQDRSWPEAGGAPEEV